MQIRFNIAGTPLRMCALGLLLVAGAASAQSTEAPAQKATAADAFAPASAATAKRMPFAHPVSKAKAAAKPSTPPKN